MKEAEYIEKIYDLWPRDGEASLEVIEVADEAVRFFPRSAQLWCLRGNLIELASADSPYRLEEAHFCYEQAVSVDPKYAAGYKEIGHFYDAVAPDPVLASRAFRKAAWIKE